jgi:hypothetical protein
MDPTVDAFIKAGPPLDLVAVAGDLNSAAAIVIAELNQLRYDIKVNALNNDQVEGYQARIKAALKRQAAIVAQAAKLGVILA